MNKLNTLSKLAIAGITGAAALTVPMEAEAAYFKLDDFNVDLERRAGIGFPNPNDDVSKTVIGGDIWPETWDRTQLEVETLVGTDPGQAVLCPRCGALELVSGAGNSQNRVTLDYAGPQLDLSVYDGWMPHYSADLNGGVLRLYGDGEVIATSDSLFPDGLPNTDMRSGPQFLRPLMLEWLDGADLTVTTLRIEIDGIENGVGNLDFSVDHKKAPEPGTILGLLAISGLGFGLKRKKQS